MKVTKLLFPMILLVASGTVFAASDESTDMSFDSLDKDGDGVVTREEAQEAPGLEQSFDDLDANADGVLEESEIGVGGPDTGEGTGSGSSMDEESGSETDY